MTHRIYYRNGQGDVLDFTAPLPNPYRMVTGEVMDYEWGYSASEDYRLRGEKIVAFSHTARTFEISLDVFAATEQIYLDAINRLHDVADFDVSALKPGRLYVNGSYLNCYITASKKTQWESPTLFLSVTLTLVSEYPVWWAEESYTFSHLDYNGSGNPDEYVITPEASVGMDYPFDYSFGDASTRMIDNALAYKPSDFILRIHGPATNPYLLINGVTYALTLELLTQEVAEVNSYERTIVKRNVLTGSESNAFGSGGAHIFEPVPPGRFALIHTGLYTFDLIVLQRRAEPLWTS